MGNAWPSWTLVCCHWGTHPRLSLQPLPALLTWGAATAGVVTQELKLEQEPEWSHTATGTGDVSRAAAVPEPELKAVVGASVVTGSEAAEIAGNTSIMQMFLESVITNVMFSSRGLMEMQH